MPSKIPKIKAAGDISLVPGNAQMWSFLRKCLNECIKGHEKCRATQDPAWFPERLLHLTTDGSNQTVLQLMETKHHPPNSPYITLSHCWGLSSLFRTTKHNMSGHLANISLKDLPSTFQDCVVVAQEFGIKYIWIDSLCIIQDDREDWARHAQCMDKIYENSLFTVAAVSSPDSETPFLGPEAPSDRGNWQAVKIDIVTDTVDSSSPETLSAEPQLKARRCDPSLSPAFMSGPLEQRGWAWQERYLSARIINFTNEEARWHCKTSETCECIGVMQDKYTDPSTESEVAEEEGDKKTLTQWRDIVTEYSRRQLTYHTDRLPALSGVASRFYNSLHSEYLAGMWLADFPRALAWYRRELSDSSVGKPKMWRSLDNGVPSWSWASISGESNWMWDYCFAEEGKLAGKDIPLESQVELIGTSCKPSSDNIFGEVETGSYIKLRGKVVEAEMQSDIHGCACVVRKGFGPQHVVPDCHVISTRDSSSSSRNLVQRIKSQLRPTSKREIAMRRALPTDRLKDDVSNGKRCKGQVCCLLLFTATQDGKNHACVLILSKQEGSTDTYERLGIGNSDSGWTRPLYKTRSKWEVWEDWGELEEWEDWEAWFADAEDRTLAIV